MNQSDDKKKGMLYMVATPIGNLEDITIRALRVLKEVDLIAAEDTRHSRILLSAYDIRTPLVSLHEHNERERSAMIVSKMESGMNVAYVSDAGTPCVSDPGYQLAAAALENGIRVVPVPGPSAAIAALSVCGFPADQFLFYGFLPPKSNSRRRFLESIRGEEQTLIFYESPARIAETMREIQDVLGDRQAVVARELTKVFEEIRRGWISDIAAGLSGSKARGEFTIIVRGASREPVSMTDDEIQERLLRLRSERSISLRDAVADVVRQTGLPRKRIYDMALKCFSFSDEN
ncbi:MAG TPA: 16S rRNA (cytidine(1402)-2'-O)-methyltransferase [Smithellaceae bacterium]|jgi:16S rRNA (cytidine1402-2'-O)-methyltransferase|nr:16S rRNA (cytidine(1402)-2'-O)-methyltransferase [Smithellaceae bacterium]HRY35067.1 16S rRNA (cytidine(1402)-2'-O)-methyltransferase [Smithellaceae bacterium]